MSPTLGVVHGFFPRAFEVVQPTVAPLSANQYWAFFSTGSGLKAAVLNASGVVIHDHVATVTGITVTGTKHMGIDRDESGSAALGFARTSSSGNTSIRIWDLVAANSAERFGTSGANGVRVLRDSLLTADGYIYWLEVQRDSGMTSRVIARSYRIPGSSIALGSLELISTINLDHAGTVTTSAFSALGAATLDGDLCFLYETPSPDSTVWHINATQGTAQTITAPGFYLISGWEGAEGRAVGALLGGGMGKTLDTDTLEAADHWPSSWAAGTNVSTTPGAADASAYNPTTFDLIHDKSEPPWLADPARSFEAPLHATYSVRPFYIMLRDPAQES